MSRSPSGVTGQSHARSYMTGQSPRSARQHNDERLPPLTTDELSPLLSVQKVDDFVNNTESIVVGLLEELQAIKTGIPVLRASINTQASTDGLKADVDRLTKKLTDIEAENKKLVTEKQRIDEEKLNLQRKVETSEKSAGKLSAELAKVKTELEKTKTRLSEVMGSKLTDNNPAITDLSDPNRPAKLADKSSEIYDNEWTDAFEAVRDIKEVNDEECVELLLKMLKVVNKFCSEKWQQYVKNYKSAITRGKELHIQDYLLKQLKDFTKHFASKMSEDLFKEFIEEKVSTAKGESKILFGSYKIQTYLKSCVELCWLMAAQDPPVVFKLDYNKNDKFDPNTFKAYTKTGSWVEFVVWPPLLLHEGGELLCKGVAQGWGKERPSSVPATSHRGSKNRSNSCLSTTLSTTKREAWVGQMTTPVTSQSVRGKNGVTPPDIAISSTSNNQTYQQKRDQDPIAHDRTDKRNLDGTNHKASTTPEQRTHMSSQTSYDSATSASRSQDLMTVDLYQSTDTIKQFLKELKKHRKPEDYMPVLPKQPFIHWMYTRTPKQEQMYNYHWFRQNGYKEWQIVNQMSELTFKSCRDYDRYCELLGAV